MRPRRHTTHQQGFTLIEMTLVIVLLGILSSVGVNMIADSYVTTQLVNNSNAYTSTARYAMERLSREMRQISYDTNTKSLLISTAAASQMSFTESDLSTTETVTIHMNGTSLMLNNATLGTDAVLAEHVTAFSLQYFDANMATPPASIGQIRFVQINLTVSDASLAQTVQLQTLVALRNNG